MPWKAPTRPRQSEITQNYNDGVVSIYSVKDVAQPGYQPVPQRTLKITVRYEEQRLGIQRLYSGRQNMVEIERVIRIPIAGKVDNQDIAVTEDGREYRIESVQSAVDVYPMSLDIALTKIVQEGPTDE